MSNNFHYSEQPGEWKYRLTDHYCHELELTVTGRGSIAHAQLFPSRMLYLPPTFSWDGATLCPDFKSLIRASCVHDALCQLVKAGKLPPENRIDADNEFRKVAIEDGMPPYCAEFLYRVLRVYALIKY